MRNLLSFLALIISLAGVGISLTREEIRCWVGLSSNACQSSRPLESPVLRPQSPQLTPSSPAAPVKAIDKPTEETSQPTVGTQGLSPVSATKPSPIAETQDSEVAPTVAKEPESPPVSSEEASQPIEVIPPPPSQPLEVTPPPTPSTP